MKYVILLALVAMAAAVDHNHGGDPLQEMIHAEVSLIILSNPGITLNDCIAKCDAVFDLASNHNEHLTDSSCRHECRHQIAHHHGHHTSTMPMDTTSA